VFLNDLLVSRQSVSSAHFQRLWQIETRGRRTRQDPTEVNE
jgi:hypothetical protein